MKARHWATLKVDRLAVAKVLGKVGELDHLLVDLWADQLAWMWVAMMASRRADWKDFSLAGRWDVNMVALWVVMRVL